MPTFIKTGGWEKRQKGFDYWLNLDEFIAEAVPQSSTITEITNNITEVTLVTNTLKYPVENSYEIQADMLADQINQTVKYFQYVIATDKYYEYLGTTTASLSDYRELTADEVTTIILNGNSKKPVNKIYTDATAMYADQKKQIEGFLYRIETDDTHYEYLGTRNANASDYKQVGASPSLIEQIINPLDVYFGNRLTPVSDDEGFYVSSANNKSAGYLVNNTGTGNAALAGFRATINSDPFGKGIFLGIQGSNYYAPWLREHGLITTKNLNIMTNDNTGNIVFSLGKSATTNITESQQDKVLSLNTDRTIVTPSLTTTLIDGEATGRVLTTREWIEGQSFLSSVPSLQTVTDVGSTTTNNIDALSINSLKLFTQTGVDVDNIGIGNTALATNTGTDVIGIGSFSLQNNVGTDAIGVGKNALRYNTGAFTCLGVGNNALQRNTGFASSGVGYSALQYNTGASSNGFGNSSLQYNKGVNSNGFGNSSLQYNTGINSSGFGTDTNKYNQGDNNTVIGHFSNSTFKDDVANLKNVASAATDVDTGLNRVIITSHGFGATNDYVNLKYTTTGTVIGGLASGTIYQVKIIDANTIEFVNNLDITTVGTDTHTFTPQFVYDNITVLGANTEPTKSNQVVLGDLSVTEVKATNANVIASSVNDLKLFAQIAVDVDNIGIGTGALTSNTGTNAIAIGTSSLGNNTQQNCVGIGWTAMNANSGIETVGVGYNAGRNNSGNYSIGIGGGSLYNNSGGYSSALGRNSLNANTGEYAVGIGYSSGQNNVGSSCNFIGSNSGIYNKGNNVTSLGDSSGLYNFGNNSTGIGKYALNWNDADNVTILGSRSVRLFIEDTGNAKNVAVAATDVDFGNNQIIITSHGFGGIGEFINLKYTTTGTAIGNITNSGIYSFEIIDANTIQFLNTNITTTGTDTHTFTPQFKYSNITLLGYDAEPTKSNQVVLGDTNITEVKTAGTYVSGGYTVATLPTGVISARAYVTDSNVVALGNFGATVTGGGANVVPVFYDGINWIIA